MSAPPTVDENDDDNDEELTTRSSIVDLFDSVCVSFGDQDAIVVYDYQPDDDGGGGSGDDEGSATGATDNIVGSTTEESATAKDNAATLFTAAPTATPICYMELQEYSCSLAGQLLYRYRPDYVLVDCFGHVAAEAVAVLACIRINVPFVPVSLLEQHAGPGQLRNVANALRRQQQKQRQERERKMGDNNDIINDGSNGGGGGVQEAMIAAVVCCDDDRDPALSILYGAGVHAVLYVDRTGNLKEQLRVPSRLPPSSLRRGRLLSAADDDDLYVLFTSGTTSAPKAVVGSHRSTFRRLRWFRDRYEASPRIGRRTKLTFVGTYYDI